MPANKKILIIGINPRNLELLGEFLNKQGYTSTEALNIEQIDIALEIKNDLALVLIDITGFHSSIWERCKKMQEQNIPFLIFSPKYDAIVQKESIEHGAKGCLTKPLVMRELSELIKKLLEG